VDLLAGNIFLTFKKTDILPPFLRFFFFMFGSTSTFGKPAGFGSAASTGIGQPQQQQSTGLFGQPSQPAQGSTPGFGQQTQQQPSTGLFGQQNTTANTGGLFGQNQQTQPGQPGTTFGQPAQATGSLFGQAQPQSTTTNMFGQQAQNQQAGGGLFGSTANTLGGGLFGAKPANSNTTFGGAASTGGLFGQQQPAANLFGQSQSTPFGQTQSTSQFGQPQAQPQPVVPQQPQAIDYVKHIAGCWDLKNPACQFKHYFYNLVHPSEVHLYQPQPEEDRALYDQAQMDNPDPSCMVPVLAVGFEGIKKRIEIQEDQLKTHQQKLNVIYLHLGIQWPIREVATNTLCGHCNEN
jgi:nuclear pore complex protein Nup54